MRVIVWARLFVIQASRLNFDWPLHSRGHVFAHSNDQAMVQMFTLNDPPYQAIGTDCLDRAHHHALPHSSAPICPSEIKQQGDVSVRPTPPLYR